MTAERCAEVAALAQEVASLATYVANVRESRDKAFGLRAAGHIGWDQVLRDHPDVSPKITGELRRRSMDLTRALARMRAS